MHRPATATSAPSVRLRLHPGRLVRLVLLASCAFSLWLAVPPAKEFLGTRERAAQTSRQLQGLRQEQARLEAQSQNLSRGSGLEEQARRQGLIDPSERSYVIEGIPQP